MASILLLGDGRFAEEIADLISDSAADEVIAFARNLPRAVGEEPRQRGVPTLESDVLPEYASTCLAFPALGSAHRRAFVEQAQAMGFRFATVIHPTARVSRTAVLAPGVLVSSGVQVAAHTAVGEFVVLNRGCLIGHHTTLEPYVIVGPGANIAGSVTIGQGARIGMGAIVLEERRVGEGAIVAAGAVVTKDVAPGDTVLGVPARSVAREREAA